MSNDLAVQSELDPTILESLILYGDLSKLTSQQKVAYATHRATLCGLDPSTAPFDILRLNGKETLYAPKRACEQLNAKHGIVIEILDQQTEGDMRVVTVRGRTRDGRQTDEIGVVSLRGKQGEDLGNALMKAVTKAKRRCTLSLCGLGMLDETEIETIRGAEVISLQSGGQGAAADADAPGGGQASPETPASSADGAGAVQTMQLSGASGGPTTVLLCPEAAPPARRKPGRPRKVPDVPPQMLASGTTPATAVPAPPEGAYGQIPIEPPTAPEPAKTPEPPVSPIFVKAFGEQVLTLRTPDEQWYQDFCEIDGSDLVKSYKDNAEQMPTPLMRAVKRARITRGLPQPWHLDKGWTVPELRASAALKRFNASAYARIDGEKL